MGLLHLFLCKDTHDQNLKAITQLLRVHGDYWEFVITILKDWRFGGKGKHIP